ncbi:MAG TPA: S41 family peptidase [Aggregatilineales bacterium]|nr:S41 family peptidase [Aggregatilineales bacterium]
MLRKISRLALPIVLCLAAVAVAGATYAQGDAGVVTVTGSIKITNQFVLQDDSEPFIALIDLTAFVKRDHDAPLPFPDQPIAGLQGDLAKGATYTMPLPISPRGLINDVGHGKGGKGLMVFALDFDTNAIGDAFMGPYEWHGWPNGIDSLNFDPGTLEVANGDMLVWAPDAKQMFPTGFGPDGKLFTDDDPVGSIGQGWTLIQIDQDKTKPFTQVRTATVDVPILEGLGANNDLSNLSYTQAFDALVKDLRTRYVFTDFKHINWDAIVSQIRPMVADAEKNKDTTAFNLAMLHFAAQFHDGHLSAQVPTDYFTKQTAGGVGLVLSQTDDGTVIARIVLDKLPASVAGMKTGAQIIQWNGKTIEQALKDTELLYVTQSSDIGTRLQQLRYIGRAPVGTDFTIQFQNPGDSTPQTAKLTTVAERQSFSLSSLRAGASPAEMPVTNKIVQTDKSAYGYIKVNSFLTDDVLESHAWEWVLKTYNALKVPGLIIDMRQNGGGSGTLARYFAGSFNSQSFELSQTFEADKDGKFVYVNKDMVDPAPVQWTKPVAVLIGPACASACEIFAAALAHDPAHMMVGRYPTAGIEAGVEAWTLPDGIYFQAPVQKIETPDGKVFLEGVGVQPTVKVPVTADTLLSSNDTELAAAEAALDKVAQTPQ